MPWSSKDNLPAKARLPWMVRIPQDNGGTIDGHKNEVGLSKEVRPSQEVDPIENLIPAKEVGPDEEVGPNKEVGHGKEMGPNEEVGPDEDIGPNEEVAPEVEIGLDGEVGHDGEVRSGEEKGHYDEVEPIEEVGPGEKAKLIMNKVMTAENDKLKKANLTVANKTNERVANNEKISLTGTAVGPIDLAIPLGNRMYYAQSANMSSNISMHSASDDNDATTASLPPREKNNHQHAWMKKKKVVPGHMNPTNAVIALSLHIMLLLTLIVIVYRRLRADANNQESRRKEEAWAVEKKQLIKSDTFRGSNWKMKTKQRDLLLNDEKQDSDSDTESAFSVYMIR